MRVPNAPLRGELVVVRPVAKDDDLARDGGFDMFLIPTARDRGLGPDAARTLARWLLGNAKMRSLTIDPYVSNRRAIRAWSKAGFRPVKEREPDQGHRSRWLLMEIDRDSLGLRPASAE